MNFTNALRDKLQTPRHPNIESTLTFPQLDIERIKKTLRLKEEAGRNGAQRQPPPDSTEFDSVERAIILMIDQERDNDLNHYMNYRRNLDDRIRGMALTRKANDVEAIARGALSQIAERIHTGLDWIESHGEQLRSTREEYRKFRLAHRLERSSRHPQHHAWHIAVALVLMCLEGVVNGKFLAIGDEFGLLGGVIQALIIAAVNIGVCFIIFGMFLVPQFNHRNLFRKPVGLLSVCFFIIWSIGFNLGVAHYRIALAGPAPEDAATQSFHTLITEPFGINDLNSWLLFLLGVIFSLIALVSGLRWDDGYPGYGTIARRRDAAREAYAFQKQDLIDELAEVRVKAIDELRRASVNIPASVDEFVHLVKRRQALHEVFRSHLDQLENSGNALLQFYRQENRRSRPKGDRVPARFDRGWHMSRPDLGVEHDEPTGASGVAIQDALADIPRWIEEITVAFEREMKRYLSIADQHGLGRDDA